MNILIKQSLIVNLLSDLAGAVVFLSGLVVAKYFNLTLVIKYYPIATVVVITYFLIENIKEIRSAVNKIKQR